MNSKPLKKYIIKVDFRYAKFPEKKLTRLCDIKYFLCREVDTPLQRPQRNDIPVEF